MKTYITFGQSHTHHMNGQLFDKDCVAIIEAPDKHQGRQLAHKFFGTAFCFSYPENNFDFTTMRYYPRGFIQTN